ncbi:MAG TPA: cysteine desulfurase family protein [Candidatus Paceibacterota bacterium]|jgi:cysteine desulfurase|nr:cysteine desulfurase family protein [Candidatus Paceibacterota bacterium]
MENKPNNRIFMDHASTTPVDPRVLEAMTPFFSEKFANPSAIYREGVEAGETVRVARLEIAKLLHCRADEIVFTASGTEADNMAVFGAFRRAQTLRIAKPHIVTTAIEHPAVLEAVRAVEADGASATYVPVSEDGLVDPKKMAEALSPETVLVSVMLANNEIGTVQPVARIARAVREYKEKLGRGKTDFPYFHVDASQGPNYLECFADKLAPDLMTLDASKIYGPKGIGLLFVRKGIALEPLIYGGGQERGLRSGTENVPFIVGFAEALRIAEEEREAEAARLTELRDRMIEEILKKFPHASPNGSRVERLANNVNICFPGLDAEFAVIQLDQKGIQCSYSSSCRTLAENNNSYVIEALGKKDCAASSLRFTLGRSTTKEDVEKALGAIVDIVAPRM